MSIASFKRVEDYIVDWIKDYTKNAGIKTLVINLSGDVDSALVALLCNKTKIPTLCVNTPCNSPKEFKRSKNLAKEFNLKTVLIDLKTLCRDITDQVSFHLYNSRVPYLTEENSRLELSINALKSGLRAPILSYISKTTNGIVVGTDNRNEYNLIRYYDKYACVDINPIADLFKSEIYELFAYITGIKVGWIDSTSCRSAAFGPDAAMDIYDAEISTDYWGPSNYSNDVNLTYDEIEWADRQNIRTSIVENDKDPVRDLAWQAYSARQRKVIAKIHALEKNSRHKYNPNLPICNIRNIPGLVR